MNCSGRTTYCNNVAHFLENEGQNDLANYARQKSIQVVYNNEKYFEILLDSQNTSSGVEDKISSFFFKKMKVIGNCNYALHEAVLFLTKYNGITQYLVPAEEPVD